MKTNFKNRFFCILFLAALALISFNSAVAENWPCFRGQTRQDISHEKDIPIEWNQTSNIAWKTPIPGVGWSSHIVFDNNGGEFKVLAENELRERRIASPAVSQKQIFIWSENNIFRIGHSR